MRDNRRRWRAITAACTLGYASHAPLDVLTSYGTLWLWPFSRARLELDWMPIVDPLFTIPLLILTLMGRAWSKRGPALLAAAFAFAYVALGERFVHDCARFAWFADGFVARDPADPTVLADMRYSLDPGGFEPLWGVRFHTDGRENPVERVELMRGRGRGFTELWQFITARSPRLRSWLL